MIKKMKSKRVEPNFVDFGQIRIQKYTKGLVRINDDLKLEIINFEFSTGIHIYKKDKKGEDSLVSTLYIDKIEDK